jgi:hypothetical protein
VLGDDGGEEVDGGGGDPVGREVVGADDHPAAGAVGGRADGLQGWSSSGVSVSPWRRVTQQNRFMMVVP